MIDFPRFPLTAFHPVHGRVTVDNHEAAQRTFTVPTDWFATAEEADAHRTDREAGMVIHNAVRGQLTLHQEAGKGVVMHSVTHMETINAQVVEAQQLAAAAEQPEPTTRPETSGSELTPVLNYPGEEQPEIEHHDEHHDEHAG